MYSPNNFAISDDVAGAISDGFRTTALPAAIAPMTGSSDNTDRTDTKCNIIIIADSKDRALREEKGEV